MSNKSLENRRKILQALDAARYGLTVAEIAQIVELSSRNTARYLSLLCKEDVIGRRKNADDRTVYFLLSRAPFRAKDRGIGSAGKNVRCIVRVNNYYREEKEVSFQGGDIHQKRSIRWLDIEMPVVRSGSRWKRLDLLGCWGDQAKRPLIAELKFQKVNGSGTDSPFYALFELLDYAVLIRSMGQNYKKVAHENSELQNIDLDFKQFPHLMIAANEEYWKEWNRKIGSKKSDLGCLVIEISQKLKDILPAGTRLDWVSFPNQDFEKQKGELEEYEPTICNGPWKMLSELIK